MSDRAGTTSPSEALLAAQSTLLALQEARREERRRQGLPVKVSTAPLSPPSPDLQNAKEELPEHLGWGSVPLTAVLRRRLHQKQSQLPTSISPLPPPSQVNSHPVVPPAPPSAHFQLHPDIGLAMLREEQVAAGRIWLLLRHLDSDGRGWLSLPEIRQRLTATNAELRVCGWRQLRNLLQNGEGLFWQRHDERLWLRSMTRVVARLGVSRLCGRPVAVPVHVLCQSIGTVRAHLYASFHSSRSADVTRPAMPIARATLKTLSGIGRHSQRHYERKVGVRRRPNYVLAGQVTPEEEQEHAWQHGRALFRFCDRKGRYGPAQVTYLAWQLPNSYEGPHAVRPNGRQKRINRKLADLLTQGITGNDEAAAMPIDGSFSQRYYRNGALAGKGYNRSSDRDAYWRSAGPSRVGRRYHLWHLLPGQQQK